MNKKYLVDLFKQFSVIEQKFGFEPIIAVIKSRGVLNEISVLVLSYFDNLLATNEVDKSYFEFKKRIPVMPFVDDENNPVNYLDFWNYELKKRSVLCELCIALKLFDFRTIGVYQPLLDDTGLAEVGVRKIKISEK